MGSSLHSPKAKQSLPRLLSENCLPRYRKEYPCRPNGKRSLYAAVIGIVTRLHNRHTLGTAYPCIHGIFCRILHLNHRRVSVAHLVESNRIGEIRTSYPQTGSPWPAGIPNNARPSAPHQFHPRLNRAYRALQTKAGCGYCHCWETFALNTRFRILIWVEQKLKSLKLVHDDKVWIQHFCADSCEHDTECIQNNDILVRRTTALAFGAMFNKHVKERPAFCHMHTADW